MDRGQSAQLQTANCQYAEELETRSARNRDHALATFGHEIGVKLALQGTAAPGYMLDEWEQTGTEARWGPYYAIDVFAISN